MIKTMTLPGLGARLALVIPLGLTACPGDDGGATGTEGDTEEPTTTGTPSTMTAPTMTGMDTTMTTAEDTTGNGTTDTGGETTMEPGTATDGGSTSTGPECDPTVVELPGDTFFPEGIHADSNGTLYVGSLTSGEILAITPCEDAAGEHMIETFNDGADTMSAVGVLVDETAGVLWVCSSDATGAMPASILGFDLDDGTLAATHTFDAGFCNDLTLDADGNLYATESFASRIMRVDQADLLMDTAAEEWSTDTLYAVAPGAFGLNGIAFDGVDALYSVNAAEGEMYSTVIQGNGSAANPTLVDLGKTMLMGPDGLRLEAPDTFLVVEQASAALTRITLDAGGNMVEVLDDTFDVPTTAVVVGPDVWVVESQLDHLVDPAGAGDPELPFVIVRRTL